MKQRCVWWSLGAALAFALMGCEKPQTLDAGAKKTDAKAWEQSGSPYMARDFKAGDKTSWDEQMRARAQAQNEYLRTQ